MTSGQNAFRPSLKTAETLKSELERSDVSLEDVLKSSMSQITASSISFAMKWGDRAFKPDDCRSPKTLQRLILREKMSTQQIKTLFTDILKSLLNDLEFSMGILNIDYCRAVINAFDKKWKAPLYLLTSIRVKKVEFNLFDIFVLRFLNFLTYYGRNGWCTKEALRHQMEFTEAFRERFKLPTSKEFEEGKKRLDEIDPPQANNSETISKEEETIPLIDNETQPQQPVVESNPKKQSVRFSFPSSKEFEEGKKRLHEKDLIPVTDNDTPQPKKHRVSEII